MMAGIRRHLETSVQFDAVLNEHQAHHSQAARSGSAAAPVQMPATSLTERFREALEAVGGHCAVAHVLTEAALMVERIIEQAGAQRIAVTDSPLVRSVYNLVRSDAELLEKADAAALFDCDIGITGAQWAVAETGTLVLESEEERHRLASLVPTVHVALVEAARLRQTLGEVLRAINDKGPDGLSPTVTFITGPSRTSDIELTLAIGVHGPAELFVIIIEGESL